MTVEYRQWMPEDSEFRAEGDGMSFSGRAIVYNSRSLPLPFTETILPGAATRSLRSRNEVKAFINHNSDLTIGSTRAGTLRLSEDERGVMAEIDLPETSYAKDLSVVVKRGDVAGMSFGFSVVKDKWNDDYSERTITELRIHEVSVVSMPAYPATSAMVRALPRLAYRTGLDVDALSDAITALETGADLSEDQATVLLEAVDRSRIDAPTAPESVPDLSEVLAMKSYLMKKVIDL